MKRIALILLGAIIAISANAQIYHTTSSFQTIETAPKIHPKFEFYVKVGANIMNADWNSFDRHPFYYDEDIPGKSKFGIDATFGLMSHFRPSRPSNFYWGVELSITQVGGGYDGFIGYRDHIYYPTSVSMWGGALSPTIGWKKEIVKNIGLDLHFNPGILCHEEESLYNESEYLDTIDEKPDLSLKGGIGIWYKKINLDLSYRGVMSFHHVHGPNYSNLIISLGYKF